MATRRQFWGWIVVSVLLVGAGATMTYIAASRPEKMAFNGKSDPSKAKPAVDLRAESTKALLRENRGLSLRLEDSNRKASCFKDLLSFSGQSAEAWRISSLGLKNAKTRPAIDSTVTRLIEASCTNLSVTAELAGNDPGLKLYNIALHYYETFLKPGGS